MTPSDAVELIDADDHELASRVGRGDRSAFGLLYLRHHDAAWRMACVATGFTADAEIALVDGFASVFSELPTDGGPEFAFRRYLLLCVRRAAIERLRCTGRVDPRDAFPADPFASERDGGENLLTGSEDSHVARALRLLPEQWRTVLWLTEVEKLTPPETSVVANVEPHTVAHIASLAWDEVRDICLQARSRTHVAADCDEFIGWLSGSSDGRPRQHDEVVNQRHLTACGSCATLHREVGNVQTGLLTAVPPVPLLGGDAQQRWLATSGHRQAHRQETVAGPVTLPRQAGDSRHERSRLDPLASSVPAARRFTEATLLRWGITEVLDVAQLLTSELVTNAVVHARSDIELVLKLNADILRVEVRDRKAALPANRGAAVDDDAGRGIRVVDSLAHRWGASRTGERKVVWFELVLSETDATGSPRALAERVGAQQPS